MDFTTEVSSEFEDLFSKVVGVKARLSELRKKRKVKRRQVRRLLVVVEANNKKDLHMRDSNKDGMQGVNITDTIKEELT